MKTIYAFYAADRYWPDREKLNWAFNDLAGRLNAKHAYLLTDGVELNDDGDVLVVVPMSGAVQARILKDARRFDKAVLYASYIDGNGSEETVDLMLRANAAPTFMDTWAVLHRESNNIMIARNRKEMEDKLLVLEAYYFVRGARILKIGQTEPWVVSNAGDVSVYEERFGVTIIPVEQSEIEKKYQEITREEARKYYDEFTANASGCEEPTDEDLWNASRMAAALVSVMEKYDADGCAIACFNLLKTGTNTCLGVSCVNNTADKVAACECDMDSCLTMLLMKKLSRSNLWMANPALRSSGLVNFSHCTGALNMNGNRGYILRSHHESGIGVSLQIDYPLEQIVTSVRISNEARDITIQVGKTEKGERLNCCRTQIYVRYDDPDKYLKTALGCHQIFAFDDIADKVRDLAELFGLNIL
ncbi:MAG: hypothetical protein IJI45_02020 [Anaerolineaceae bacterium]|nr:hypothetical protein [Anaerolineaceae bacterium]